MLECLQWKRKLRIDKDCLKAKIEVWIREDDQRRILFCEKNAQAVEPSESIIIDQDIDTDELHEKV